MGSFSIFSVVPKDPVNKGIAEPYRSPLPQQLAILADAAKMAQADKKLQADKAAKEQKNADDFWKSITNFSGEGLTVHQQAEYGKMTEDFLSQRSKDINTGTRPTDMTGTIQGRQNIKDYKTRKLAINDTVKEIDSDFKTDPLMRKKFNEIEFHKQFNIMDKANPDMTEADIADIFNMRGVYETDGNLEILVDSYDTLSREEFDGHKLTLASGEEVNAVYTKTMKYPPIAATDRNGVPIMQDGRYQVNDTFYNRLLGDKVMVANLTQDMADVRYSGDLRDYVSDKINQLKPVETSIDNLRVVKPTPEFEPTSKERLEENKYDTLKAWTDKMIAGDWTILNRMGQRNNGISFTRDEENNKLTVVANKTFLENINNLQQSLDLVRQMKWKDQQIAGKNVTGEEQRQAVEKKLRGDAMSDLEIDIAQKAMKDLQIELGQIQLPEMEKGKWKGTPTEVRKGIAEAVAQMVRLTDMSERGEGQRFGQTLVERLVTEYGKETDEETTGGTDEEIQKKIDQLLKSG